MRSNYPSPRLQFNVLMSPGERQVLDEIARRQGISSGAAARQAIAYFAQIILNPHAQLPGVLPVGPRPFGPLGDNK